MLVEFCFASAWISFEFMRAVGKIVLWFKFTVVIMLIPFVAVEVISLNGHCDCFKLLFLLLWLQVLLKAYFFSKHNSNGSFDVGVFQINQINWPAWLVITLTKLKNPFFFSI